MPLVRIDLRQGKSAAYIRAVGDAVNTALHEAFSVPVRDRFQIFSENRPEQLVYDPNYLEVERTDDVIIIQVFLSTGRNPEQKQAFYARLAGLLEEKPGIRPQDVIITLVENDRADWSFGNGQAQYLVLPKEQWR